MLLLGRSGADLSEGRNCVLITGASGFIGRHCLSILAKSDSEVHATSRVQSGHTDDRTVWHQVDLLDPQQLTALIAKVRPSHLLHLAWYSDHSNLYSAPENVAWVRASLELLGLFVQQGGKRVVMTGTCAEYAEVEGLCSEETTALAPRSTYGVCKRSLGDLFQAYGGADSFTGAWARLFFLYGPGEHPDRLVASVVRSILSGQPALCSHGGQVRDYLYIEDAADALVRLLDSEFTGAVNVSSGKPISLREVILAAARQLDGEHLVKFGAVSPREYEPPQIVGDAQRLRDELGWSPRFELQSGMERTIRWWREVESRSQEGSGASSV
jgi:nucleoside-diphosphate-sugar epimerase